MKHHRFQLIELFFELNGQDNIVLHQFLYHQTEAMRCPNGLFQLIYPIHISSN